jgi:hypothetical protein
MDLGKDMRDDLVQGTAFQGGMFGSRCGFLVGTRGVM